MNGKRVKRIRKATGVKHPGRRYGGVVGVSQLGPEKVVSNIVPGRTEGK